MFKKKHDPFEHLFQQDQPKKETSKGFLRKVVTKEQEDATYSSPFRTSQSQVEAQKRKVQRFPTVSASSGGNSSAEMGFKVIDAARKRAKDIAVPRYLQGNDERQRRRLDKLERKEDSLQYKKDSQKIVKVKGEVGKSSTVETEPEAVESTKPVETEPEEAETTKPVETDEPVKPIETGEPVKPIETTEPVETDEPVKPIETTEPVETTEPIETTEPVEATEPVAAAEPLTTTEPSETTEPIETTEPVQVTEPVESTEASKPIETTEASQPIESTEASQPTPTTKASPDDEGIVGESLVADASAAAETPAAAETSATLQKPKNIKDTPRVPFATGIFALWTRSDKRGQPVASPDDPEFIVKFDKGYMSKALYDTLEYEEAVHKQEMDQYTKENTDKYDAKAQEYEDHLTSLKSQIAELEATMEQLQLDTTDKINISAAELSARMIESNAKHSNTKNVIFKETENSKAAKIDEKAAVVAKQDEVKAENEELEAQRAEADATNQELLSRIDELTTQLDSKQSAIQELNDQQAEIQASIDALEQQKDTLVADATAADELHNSNIAILEGISNKDYLPKINALDSQISQLLSSLALVKQETANQHTEFAAVSKRLEEENEERKEKLRLEEENRKRLEAERFQKQRDEHDQHVLTLQQEHERQLAEASQKAADTELLLQQEREKRELVERERVRLQGEKAIQEQEQAKLADKALEDEVKERNHNRAQAIDAAEAARARNAKSISNNNAPALSTPKEDEKLNIKDATTDNSLYEYFTEKEVRYVNSNSSLLPQN